MTDSGTRTTENPEEARLPLRDWILLPLLGLLTVCLLVVSTTVMASRSVSQLPSFFVACTGLFNPVTGAHAHPNSVCWDKKFESQRVEYRFNGCGHRTAITCGSDHPDAYRIVMMGSSLVMGDMVAEDKTIAALLPVELSRRLGRRVELYNLGLPTQNPRVLSMRMDEVLAAKPDLVLWIVTPPDASTEQPPPPDIPVPEQVRGGFLASAWFRIDAAFSSQPVPDAIRSIWQQGLRQFDDSATGVTMRHLVYLSQYQYVRGYLAGEDHETGYMRENTTPEWQSNMRLFDIDAAKIEARAQSAGVPIVATLVPGRAQAAMISMGEWPSGFNPYLLGDQLRTIVVSHGETYIDLLEAFRKIPNSEQYYFPVDGHPDAKGHAVITQLLADELTNGAVPALNPHKSSDGMAKGR